MGNIKVYVENSKDIYYYPCVNCGSEDIIFDDYGYSSFNVAFGRCKICGREVLISPCDFFISKE